MPETAVSGNASFSRGYTSRAKVLIPRTVSSCSRNPAWPMIRRCPKPPTWSYICLIWRKTWSGVPANMMPASIALSTVVRSIGRMLVDGGAAQDLCVHRRRHVARRIAKVQRHLVRRHVPEQLLGTGARLGLALAGIDQRGIGEPVDGNVVAAASLAPALAIGVVDRGRAAVSSQERRLHVAARADAAGAARRGR